MQCYNSIKVQDLSLEHFLQDPPPMPASAGGIYLERETCLDKLRLRPTPEILRALIRISPRLSDKREGMV